MGKIEGDGSITPQMREAYKTEFQKGVNLFKNSLDEYKKADFEQKKIVLKDVMDKALHVLNETAKAAFGDEAVSRQIKLQDDYNDLLKNENKNNYAKLKKDIESLKDFH